MQTTVDRFGRVVIPKAVRERLGISAGTPLTVDHTESAVVLRVSQREPQLADEDGVLVFTGEPTADLAKAVDKSRRERSEQLLRNTW